MRRCCGFWQTLKDGRKLWSKSATFVQGWAGVETESADEACCLRLMGGGGRHRPPQFSHSLKIRVVQHSQRALEISRNFVVTFNTPQRSCSYPAEDIFVYVSTLQHILWWGAQQSWSLCAQHLRMKRSSHATTFSLNFDMEGKSTSIQKRSLLVSKSRARHELQAGIFSVLQNIQL